LGGRDGSADRAKLIFESGFDPEQVDGCARDGRVSGPGRLVARAERETGGRPLGPVSLVCVTGERAQAYGRVVKRLDDLSGGKLRPAEQQIVREAADALFFCDDLASDLAVQEARAALHGLSRNLVESDRLLPETAEALVSDVEGCGPLALVG
jgi:hypothetical protein